MTLRDFARLGLFLIEARNTPAKSSVPEWFMEALMAPVRQKNSVFDDLEGFPRGSAWRNGFVRLGGGGNRVALLGPYGNSLQVDFDRRLVIAVFASYPKLQGAALRAHLNALWTSVEEATVPERPSRDRQRR